jgi:hypothetical protein
MTLTHSHLCTATAAPCNLQWSEAQPTLIKALGDYLDKYNLPTSQIGCACGT